MSTTTLILPDLQRDLCQNLGEHQPSLLLDIQLWLGGMIFQTQHIRKGNVQQLPQRQVTRFSRYELQCQAPKDGAGLHNT